MAASSDSKASNQENTSTEPNPESVFLLQEKQNGSAHAAKMEMASSDPEPYDVHGTVDEELEIIPTCSFKNLTAIVTKGMENFFYNFGYRVGKYPWTTILLSLLLCGVCSAGLSMFYVVTDDEFLWTPYGSPFIEDKEWIEENFPKDTRYESVILSSQENVLLPEYIQFLSDLNHQVENLTTTDGKYTYRDLCTETYEEDQPCYQESILKLWNFDNEIIGNLTKEMILEAVTDALSVENSAYARLLSGVEWNNATGEVVSATALMNVWLLKENTTKEENQAAVDEVAMDWELGFIDLCLLQRDEVVPNLPGYAQFYLSAERSYNDEIDGAVNSNLVILFIGCALIVIYIALVLGRPNALQQRILLSFTGLVVIGISITASFGLCFFMSIFYADMHPIIPFLLLGIGVDDMFVIVQSLENLPDAQKALPVDRRIALAMKHAGVSITVTSATDMAAFLISSSTSLPILRTFCLFCAMGVLFLYIFAATFFVGCLTLDEQRMSDRKACPCSKPKKASWLPNEFSQKDLSKTFIDKYITKYLLKLPVKICVLVSTLAMFGVGVYGVTQMRVDYNSIWYMRQSSYQAQFYASLTEYFPENGERVQVYVGDVSMWNHLEEMEEVYNVLFESPYVRQDTIEYWFHDFHNTQCIQDESDIDDEFFGGKQIDCTDELTFKRRFLLFLNLNKHYAADLKFNVSMIDTPPAVLWEGGFEITASRANFQHGQLLNTTIQNVAMEQVKEGMEGIVFENETFTSPIAYCFMYVQWEANKLIVNELIRNLSLTFVAIILVTLVLVANLRVSLFVLLSVVFTVADVAGFAHFMGLTIEIVTSILLILSCGLALDYAAHIGVVYVCSRRKGRNERAKESLVSMGAAVFHGGFSTFTAFALLAFSDSYVFTTFFKMFAMVVLFGLAHGLIFLPVILSLFGPKSHDKEPVYERKKNSVEKNGHVAGTDKVQNGGDHIERL